MVGGGVSIGQTANQTTINQSTQRGAINWRTFNIGSQQSVDFVQPSSAAITLNKVVTPNPSQIAGRIEANGQIVIENQSGVFFYKGSQVNTSGLMVTAAASGNAATQAFLNGGKLALDQAAQANAAVVNQGHITVKQAGLAALVAPQVVNSGVITAKLGRVVLASGTKATLDLYGDGMLSIDVTGQVVQAPDGALALVTNSGLIVADGGSVQLTANAADGLVQTLVNAGGTIRARTVGTKTGVVTLNAVRGSITVEGQLDATGAAPGTMGGNIAVNATGKVTVASGARIDASGQAGGGVVAIGTTLKRAAGGPGVTSIHTAANVTVAAGARIAADATKKGDGGRVTVLSTLSTDIAGVITVTGGPQGGNGGLAETSSNGALSIAGSATVDASAPRGMAGLWYLDPTNIVIDNTLGSALGTGGTTAGGDTFKNNSGKYPDTITATSIANSLNGGTDVTLQAINDLTLDAGSPITATTGSGNLTLQAGESISLNANITLKGSFTGKANDAAGVSGAGANETQRGANPGSFTMASGTTIDTSAGANSSISISVGAASTVNATQFTVGPITLAGLKTGSSGNLMVSDGSGASTPANGSISQTSDNVTIGGTSNFTTNTTGATVTLNSATNALTGAVTLITTGAGANASVTNSVSGTGTVLGASTVGGNLTVTGLDTFGITETGVLTVAGTSSFTDTAANASINLGTSTNALTGAVTLDNGTSTGAVTLKNSVSGTGTVLGASTVGGNLTVTGLDTTGITETGVLTVAGTSSFTDTAANASINLGTSTNALTGAVTLDNGTSTGVVTLKNSVSGTGTVLGASTVGGNLTVTGLDTAGITETGVLTVAGTSSFTDTAANASINLGTSTNALTGAVTLDNGTSTGVVTLKNSVSGTGTMLGASTVGGNLTVTGLDTFGISETGVLTVKGTSSFTETAANATINLSTQANALTGAVALNTTGSTANASLSNAVATTLAASNVGGNLTVTTTKGSDLTLGAAVTAGKTISLTSAGTIDQTAGAITAATLTGSSVGTTSLLSGNTIGVLGPFAVIGGDFQLVDNSNLTIAGVVSAADIFIKIALAGGTLTLGNGTTGAALSATAASNPTMTLVADNVTEGVQASTITATDGTVTIAPFSTGTPVSLGGISSVSGTLLVGGTLLGDLNTGKSGTLRIGSYNDVANGGAGTTTAGNISIDGALNLTGTAATLRLDSTGSITQAASIALTVATLTGTAAHDVALLGTSNAIGTLTAFGTGGNFVLVDNSSTLVVVGLVQSTADRGSVFIEQAAGQVLDFVNNGSVIVSNGTIGLVTDTLTAAASGVTIAAGTTGLIEFAPRSTTTALSLSGDNALSAMSAGVLRIGGYHDAASAGTNVVSATSIDISGALTFAAVPTLRLDANGPITESGGPLSVGTLSISTNGSAGSVTLGNPLNVVSTLDNVTVAGGNFTFADNAATLTIPQDAVVYGSVVAISNSGPVTIDGALGAFAGALNVTGSDILVGADGSGIALVAGTGTVTLNGTSGGFTQTSGLINGNGVTIDALTGFTQNGGTIINVAANAGTIGLVVNARSIQQTTGVLASNNDMLLVGTNGISTSGSILGAGAISLLTGGSFTQSGGIIAANDDLLLHGLASAATPIGGDITQTSGTIVGGGSVILLGNFSTTNAQQGASGIVGGSMIEIASATESATSPFQHFAGGRAVSHGSNVTVACNCTGLLTDLVNPAPAAPASTPSLPSVGATAGTLDHLIIDVIDNPSPAAGTYNFSAPIAATWMEIHTSGSLVQNAGGAVTATLLTGTTGYGASGTGPIYSFTTPITPAVVSDALLTGSTNAIVNLGSFLATGNFALNDAPVLTVVGSVVAGTLNGGGQVLALSAPSITIDQSGLSSVQSGLTIVANGSLSAPAAFSGSSVTPGQILLQTDTLAILPLVANGTVIDAPDGLVAIAPRTTGAAVSLDATAASSVGTLSLSPTLLSAINTLGKSTGTAGTETLLLGSVDGATPLAGAIEINTGVALGGVARNLVLDATGPVQQGTNGSLSVTSVAGISSGTLAAFTLNGARNAIGELGNVGTRTNSGATTYATAGSLANLGGLVNLTSDGNVQVRDTGGAGALTVVGGVTANASTLFPSGTIALTGSSIAIITGNATLSTGAIVSAGSLLATAGTVNAGTLTPSLITLQADSLSIASSGTSAIVRAPSGQVAIAPLTSGNTISIDATQIPSATTLSLGVGDLALIDTLSGPLSGVTPGPVGTQTLSLGSLDNGATITAGGIQVNTAIRLGGGANLAANTLALYSTGDVVETPKGATPVGAISVNTLTGTVTNGNIYLNGTNQFANLGNLATRGAVTKPRGVNANLLAPNGTILIGDTQSLNVVTNVQGSSGAIAEIDVGGTNLTVLNGGTNLTVLNGGTVQAGSVYLRAGNGAVAGSITVDALGSVLALAPTGTADLVAGVQYVAATPTSSPSSTYGTVTTGGSIAIDGLVSAGNNGTIITGTVGLFSGGNIDELGTNPGTVQGTIQAGVLLGFAETGYAHLTGTGSPSSNLIGNLGPFSTNTGFVLHDAESLLVVGALTHNSINGITIAVAPSGSAVGSFGIGDLALGSFVTAVSGAVKLEATGNVYEAGAGFISNSAGRFAISGGLVSAAFLTSQAGVIPDTETGGNTAGTIPASAATFGRAIDWFGNENAVGTVSAVTATGNFLLYTVAGPGLANPTVAGTLTAGTLPTTVGTITPAYTVDTGPFGFGTLPGATPSPFAEIDVMGAANLLVPGIVHVGIDGSVTGNVTLRAGNSTTAGAVTIGGGVFAANGGTVSVSAGFDPTIASGFDAACGAACNITINGVIWGDQLGAAPALASLVTLNAAGSIDETPAAAAIGAATLTGFAGGHVNLAETVAGTPATGAAANQIGTLAAFISNRLTDDAQGFMLRDGRALVVAGPVADDGATASHGISIAVVPGSGTVYAAGDLLLQGNISAATTTGAVVLQATGNIVQSGGSISAGTLIAQAGAIPNTESLGSQPGTIPASVILSSGSIILTDANQITHLGSAGVGVSAEGAIALTNVPTLTVNGSVVSALGTINIINSGSVTINSVVSAMASDVTIASQGSITSTNTINANGNVTLTATTDITNESLIHAGGDATLSAGGNITNDNTINAAGNATITALGSIANNNSIVAGNDAIIRAGTTITNSGVIMAVHDAILNGGSNTGGDIDNTAGATITAGDITTLTAGGSINDGALAVITAAGAGSPTAPTVSLIAQNGSIAEAAGGTIAATSATGNVQLTAGSSIAVGGAISAAGNTGIVGLTAGGSITQSSGSIIAGGPGTTVNGTLIPSISLVAQAGTISQAGVGTIAATSSGAGNVQITAGSTLAGSILVAGAITASGTAGVVGLTAGTSITQSSGSIVAGGAGTIVSGTLIPNLTLLAQTGTISQAAAGSILAPNNAGMISMIAKQSSITTGGSIIAGEAAEIIAGTSITQLSGVVEAFGSGTISAAGTDTWDVLLQAKGGPISQSAGALISAPNAAGVIELNATGDIGFGGAVEAPGSTGGVALFSGGGIVENAATGILTAGTLIGAAANGATLTAASGTGNLVATLGSFNTGTVGTGDFVLVTEENLSVIAPVIAATGSIAITATHVGTSSPSSLSNGSTIAAQTGATLLADVNVTNTGSVIAQSDSASVIASTGTLFNSGLIDAKTSATLFAGTDVTNTNTGSVIAQTTNLSMTANDGTLTNGGLLQAGAVATLMAHTDITNTGSVIAQSDSASVTASTGTLFNSGLIDAKTSATLFAGTDVTNTNTGSVIAQTTNLSMTANNGTLTNGGLLQAGAVATLMAHTDITNTGSVIAQGDSASVTASTGTLFNSGLIDASTSATLLAGTNATNTGSVIAQTTNLSMTANDGALTNGGLLQAGAVTTLLAQTNITNTGSVIAQSDSASVTASTGTLFNSGLIEAKTSATLFAGTDATNTGSVIAQTTNLSMTANDGALTNHGLLQAGSVATLLAHTNITNTGSVIAQSDSALVTASTGTLFNSGLIDAKTSATLFGGTDVTNTNTGSVIAQTNNLSMTANDRALTNHGLLQAGAAATLFAHTDVTNTGSVIAQSDSASLTAATGTLSNSGLIDAKTSLTLLGDAGLRNTGSVIARTGNATLTATSGTLFDTGLISAAAATGVVMLTANGGPIVQSGTTGSIIAGSQVTMIASGDITLGGLVQDGVDLILNSGGAITETGTLITGLLTGAAIGAVDLLGATPITNKVANLGNFTANRSFTLDDGANLLISAVVSAPTINILDGVNTISLGDGGFITGGAIRPSGTLTAAQLPPNSNIETHGLGAYLSAGSVIQTGGKFTVSNLPGTQESILSITLAQNGNGKLALPGGLNAPATWLIVGVGNGSASGQIAVKALDFIFTSPPGQGVLFGTVNGFTGQAAASASFIEPQPNANFRINNCPIHSVNCVLLPTQGVPPTNPLNDIALGAPLNNENPEDLVLPVVSDERYELVPCDDPNADTGCPADATPPTQH